MRTSMKTMACLVTTISLLLLILPSNALNAQGRGTVKRLKFAPGTSSAIVKGIVTKDAQVTYQLEAKKGQHMRVKLIGI